MADIIDLIYADHDWLRRQFFRLDDASAPDELAAIWDQLSARLDAHADAEETVFYPALLKHGGRDDPGNRQGTRGTRPKTRLPITTPFATPYAIPADTHPAARSGSKPSSRPAPRTVSTSRRKNARRCPTSSRARHCKSARELGMKWLQFYARHDSTEGIDNSDKDADAYLDEHG